MFSGIKRGSLADGRGAFLVLVALVVYFWLPALWGGKLLIHGDSGHHGLPLIRILGEALAGHDSLLWSNRVFGGQPLLAEGQGGFANPLNILSAWLFEPVLALGFVHCLSMVVGGGGVFCLCRVLGIGRWAATFAGIAVVFSAPWVASQHNLPMSMTQAWIPWLIAATEYWLKRPTAPRAALIAVAFALLVFGGYPQLTHGAVLYVLASLLVMPFQREGRAFLAENWRAFLASGLLAVVLGICLSAIQLAPLLELVGLSQRSQGISVYFSGFTEVNDYLRGLFYFYLGENPQGRNLFNLASIATLLLAGLLLFFRMPQRLPGQLLAAFLLFNLGIGFVSPLFNLGYYFHLIPGLHYFRSTYSYIPVSLIGIAVVAAAMLDALSGKLWPALRKPFQKHRNFLGGGLILYGGGMAYLCYMAYAPVFSKWNFLAPALLLLSCLLLALTDRRRWFPLCAVLILALDVALLHMHEMIFHERSIVEQPESVRAIAAEPDHADYHVMDASPWGGLVFFAPTNPDMTNAYRRLLGGLSPFPTGLQWRIPSVNGVLALPLARRSLLDPVFDAEIHGKAGTHSGLRLIDILGIRYISAAETLTAESFSPFRQDLQQHVFIYRNAAAKPRFQIYWNANGVDTPEQALAGLQAASGESLFVERLRGENFPAGTDCPTCVKPDIGVVSANAMRYKVNVEVPRDAWLFLADANYPGWQATVNGVRQPVYSAQVLGKAVPLKAGRNEVVIRYVPWSFYGGAALSAAALLLVLFLLLRPILQRPRRPQSIA